MADVPSAYVLTPDDEDVGIFVCGLRDAAEPCHSATTVPPEPVIAMRA